MAAIPIERKLTIFGVGILSSIIVFFMVYVLFARILTQYIFDNINNYDVLLLLLVSLLLISFASSIIVGILVVDDITKTAVLKASLISYLANFLFLVFISYFFIFSFYPDVFENLVGFEIIIVFPTVMLYFSIYGLGHPLYLVLLSIVSYYVFFVIFIEAFYQYKFQYKKR